MELKERFFILKKRAGLIILITLIATVTVAILSFYVITPKYKADTTVLIGKEAQTNNSGTNYYDIMMYQTMVKTYSKLARSRTVAEDVIEKLRLTSLNTVDLISMIEIVPDKDTQFLTITVTSNNSKQAKEIANQFAISLKEVSLKVYKVDSVKLLETAQLPTEPSSPKPIRNIFLTFFIGITFSIGLAFLLEYLDITIKTKEDVEMIELAVIGTISLVNIKDEDGIIW